MKHHALWLLLFTFGVGSASAAPIYRCGKTYSQTPCPGGTVVEATDSRSAAQRAEARRIADNERKAAADMESDRKQKEEAEAQRARAEQAARPASAPPEAEPWVVNDPNERRRRVANPDRPLPPVTARPRPTPH